MLRSGQRVQEPTKKVGRAPRTGTVIAVRGEFVDVRWDDGHESTVVGAYLVPQQRRQSQRVSR